MASTNPVVGLLFLTKLFFFNQFLRENYSNIASTLAKNSNHFNRNEIYLIWFAYYYYYY